MKERALNLPTRVVDRLIMIDSSLAKASAER